MELCGSWSGWTHFDEMTKGDDGFTIDVDLPFGKHTYKFILDGNVHTAAPYSCTHSRSHAHTQACMHAEIFRDIRYQQLSFPAAASHLQPAPPQIAAATCFSASAPAQGHTAAHPLCSSIICCHIHHAPSQNCIEALTASSTPFSSRCRTAAAEGEINAPILSPLNTPSPALASAGLNGGGSGQKSQFLHPSPLHP